MREVVKMTSPEQAEKEAEIRKARKQLEDIEGALGRISKLAVTKQEDRGGRELLIFIYCMECKFYDMRGYCDRERDCEAGVLMNPDDFCSRAERK